ncbi:S8 family serine peptidase [Couchioplanes caeruleus subsp. azureus]|uniref:S8 family serine peptidase n=1 Tax=Couchioplanes caeruleus TaxID=56438 RepID=UPI0016706CB9
MTVRRARVRQYAAGVAATAAATVVTALTGVTPAQAASPARAAAVADYSFNAAGATLTDVRRITRADVAAQRGYTGRGIGIALVDTGVAPVEGLTSGNVANGPDLSFESQVANLRWRDTYGHGTHMAGIIAGRDPAPGGFSGVAPDAKLLSLKVGAANGAVDVTQVIAAIDWVVEHRNDDPRNPIRVLNLSYGTDGVLSWQKNPLSHAVQNAYRAGIAVVVASGNTGGAITNPAYDPYVITVGATDPRGTTSPADDQVASFTSMGAAPRVPDLLVPGRSLVSLRVPGSMVDAMNPSARVGERYFVGSGTSQAAAVATGAAAVLLDRYPGLTPDSLKCTLRQSGPSVGTSGGRMVDLDRATAGLPTLCRAVGPHSTGTGSIQAARGTSIVSLNGVPLTGERDIFGPLKSATWAAASTAERSWQGGSWMGRPMTGTGWAGTEYGQANWAGRSWSGTNWAGRSWSEIAWAGATWTGRSWSNTLVNGVPWSGRAWSGVAWQHGTKGSWLK